MSLNGPHSNLTYLLQTVVILDAFFFVQLSALDHHLCVIIISLDCLEKAR